MEQQHGREKRRGQHVYWRKRTQQDTTRIRGDTTKRRGWNDMTVLKKHLEENLRTVCLAEERMAVWPGPESAWAITWLV